MISKVSGLVSVDVCMPHPTNPIINATVMITAMIFLFSVFFFMIISSFLVVLFFIYSDARSFIIHYMERNAPAVLSISKFFRFAIGLNFLYDISVDNFSPLNDRTLK